MPAVFGTFICERLSVSALSLHWQARIGSPGDARTMLRGRA